jgi:hypothetical protein
LYYNLCSLLVAIFPHSQRILWPSMGAVKLESLLLKTCY